jgi:hypothetical protein
MTYDEKFLFPHSYKNTIQLHVVLFRKPKPTKDCSAAMIREWLCAVYVTPSVVLLTVRHTFRTKI